MNWTTKGIKFADQGNHKRALGAFYWAVQKEPNNAFLWFNIGWSLTNVGNLENAANALKQAIKLDPNYSNAWYNLGGVLTQLRRFDEASIAFKKAADLDPQNFGIFDIHSHLNSLIQKNIERININPNDTFSLFNLGILHAKDENYLDAIQAFDNVIQLEPDHARAWYMKGVVFSKLERFIDAISAFNKAIEIDPDYEKAREKKAFLNNNLPKINNMIPFSNFPITLNKNSPDNFKLLSCSLLPTDPKKTDNPYFTLKNLENIKKDYYDFENYEDYIDYLMGYDWITTLLIEETEYDMKTPNVYDHDLNESIFNKIWDVSNWLEFGEDGRYEETIGPDFSDEFEDYELSEEISETDSILEYYRDLYEDSPRDEEGYDVSEYDEEPEDLDRSYRDDCSSYDFSNMRDINGQNRNYKYYDD